MRSFRHRTPRYIFDRVALILHERSNPGEPWLTRQMVKILDGLLRPHDIGLEFGSGRSTTWFAERLGALTSVEHDDQWYGLVRPNLSRFEDRVRYFLRPDGKAGDGGSKYVQVAELFPDSTLDFVLIDGVARDYCAAASLGKLKRGGLIVIDNVNWFLPRRNPSRAPNSRGMNDGCASTTWEEVWRELSRWRCIWTTDGVTDTALWLKP